DTWFFESWRRRRDSNPRYAFGAYNGLANRRLQPLGHVSASWKAYNVHTAGSNSRLISARRPILKKDIEGSTADEPKTAPRNAQSWPAGSCTRFPLARRRQTICCSSRERARRQAQRCGTLLQARSSVQAGSRRGLQQSRTHPAGARQVGGCFFLFRARACVDAAAPQSILRHLRDARCALAVTR